MKIRQAMSSAILVVLLTAPMAWAQDNIRAAMEAANKEWSAAYNSLNGKAFPALYTKDAVLMPPGVQPINGSEAIGQFWTDLIKAGNRKNFAIDIASIQRDGKYAYQTARWTLDLVKDNGEVTKVVAVASVFSKNRRTASGWPKSTFTMSINWAPLRRSGRSAAFSFAVSGCPSSQPPADTVIDFVAVHKSSGRNFSAWIGLVPTQHSSGGKDRLGSISKQGDRYLRSLFVAGALAVIRYAKIHGTKHRPWLTALLTRRPTKVAAIALANKLARMAWAMMARGERYRQPVALAA